MHKTWLVLLVLPFFACSLAAVDFDLINTIDQNEALHYGLTPAAINTDANLIAVEYREREGEDWCSKYNIWNVSTGAKKAARRGEISESLKKATLLGFQGMGRRTIVHVTFEKQKYTATTLRDHITVAIYGDEGQLLKALLATRGAGRVNTLFFFENSHGLHLAIVYKNKTDIWRMCSR